MITPSPRDRDDAAIAAFVQRFAADLSDAGFPRMPARAFCALLSAESGSLTAAELAEQLKISPAAVSGAVRFLGQANLVTKERPAGARRDHYVVDENAWFQAITHREQLLTRWRSSLNDGANAVGLGSAAGRRLAESAAFLAFIQRETAEMLERWEAHRDGQNDRSEPN